MRILRIVLFSVLFWALSEGSDASEVSFRKPAVRLAALAVECPDGAEAAWAALCGELRCLSPNLPSSARVAGPELSVRPASACRDVHAEFRPAGARMGGDWCAPVKNRYRFSCFADFAPAGCLILRLCRLVI